MTKQRPGAEKVTDDEGGAVLYFRAHAGTGPELAVARAPALSTYAMRNSTVIPTSSVGRTKNDGLDPYVPRAKVSNLRAALA